MTKRPSAYYRPASLDQALELLKRPDTRPLAGGTKLLAGHITDAVVDLQDLPLDGIELLHQSLVVGAIVRLTDLDAFLDTMTESGAHSQLDGWPGLIRQAIRQAGPNTYRNMPAKSQQGFKDDEKVNESYRKSR